MSGQDESDHCQRDESADASRPEHLGSHDVDTAGGGRGCGATTPPAAARRSATLVTRLVRLAFGCPRVGRQWIVTMPTTHFRHRPAVTVGFGLAISVDVG